MKPKSKPNKRIKTAARGRVQPIVRRAALRDIEATTGNLYEAVAQYVENNGGSIIVVGGIEIQQWPHDPKGKYRVAVSLLGAIPERLL
ncbi:MAG TPA: hypothetical protein VGM62_00275 [Chthoniobacterales bacterium]